MSIGNLDIQYIMGVAQNTASIYWYEAGTPYLDPFVQWVTDIANSPNPPLVNSMSWGSSELVLFTILIVITCYFKF